MHRLLRLNGIWMLLTGDAFHNKNLADGNYAYSRSAKKIGTVSNYDSDTDSWEFETDGKKTPRDAYKLFKVLATYPETIPGKIDFSEIAARIGLFDLEKAIDNYSVKETGKPASETPDIDGYPFEVWSKFFKDGYLSGNVKKDVPDEIYVEILTKENPDYPADQSKYIYTLYETAAVSN